MHKQALCSTILFAVFAIAARGQAAHYTIHGDAITFLSGATDDDMAVLDEHPNLKTIGFSSEPFSAPLPSQITDAGFAHISHCMNLEKLTLDAANSMQITDQGFRNLSALINLQELCLDSMHNLGDSSMQTIGGFKKLRVLHLYDVPITDAGITKIKDLAQLQDLQLGNTQVGDASMQIIATFSKLKTLDLQHTRITNAGILQLKHLNLQWLCLNGTGVSDLSALSDMTDMQSLFLENTRIDDAALDHLAKLKKLQYLYLSGTQLTDAGVKKLAGFDQISALKFDDLPITDDCVSTLLGMKGLKEIQINHTKLSDDAIQKLTNAGIQRINAQP